MASFLKTTFDNLVKNINTTFNQNPDQSPRTPQQRGQSRARASNTRPTPGTPNSGDPSPDIEIVYSNIPDFRAQDPHSQRNQSTTRSSANHQTSTRPQSRHNTAYRCQHNPYNTRNSTTNTTSTSSSTSPRGYTNSAVPNMASNVNANQQNHLADAAEKRLDITDVRDPQDINQLSAKQLKIILTRNCVDYKGIFEKEVLREKVMQLWIDCNERRSGSALNTGSQDTTDDIDDSQACKICMEREINCVLLECGHMLTCVTCGRKLAECPICRQNVTRCVRTFRG